MSSSIFDFFFTCLRQGHDFGPDNRCRRCTAEKGGPTLLDVFRSARTKLPQAVCRSCWERHGREPEAVYYASGRGAEVCTACTSIADASEIVWVAPEVH